jgi:hypothetical protein
MEEEGPKKHLNDQPNDAGSTRAVCNKKPKQLKHYNLWTQ